METRNLNILLIEDDAIEVMKMHRVLSGIEQTHSITEATNGEVALSILKDYDSLPDIILLDLNMPKIDGIEFLTILKNDEKLKFIPTIILTTSNNQQDLLACYQLGIAGYVVKPLRYEEYVEKITRLISYWSVNELFRAL